MSNRRSPAQVIRAVPAGVSRLVTGGLTAAETEELLDRLAGLYAEQTCVRHPFAPLGDTPLATRRELREHFAAAARNGGIDRFDVVDERLHETQDPEVVVLEFAYSGTVGGRSFLAPCIFVARVRDGEIVESRDYADHVGLARALGQLESMTAALVAG